MREALCDGVSVGSATKPYDFCTFKRMLSNTSFSLLAMVSCRLLSSFASVSSLILSVFWKCRRRDRRLLGLVFAFLTVALGEGSLIGICFLLTRRRVSWLGGPSGFYWSRSTVQRFGVGSEQG